MKIKHLAAFLIAGLATINSAFAASTAAPQQSNPFSGLLIMAVFIGLMYFFMIRPQSKRAKEQRNLLGALNSGDEVITNGGLLGKIKKLDEQFLTLELCANTQIQVQKSAVTSVMPKGTLDKIAKA
jgi:preprotein translocase subunit YajC